MAAAVVMSDVARAAKVSSQTVSRVLNNHPSVRPETRARVLAAVKELGYRPNLAARSLAAGQPRTVGILLLTSLGHGTAATFAALADSAHKQGFHLLVAMAEEGSQESLNRAIDEVGGHHAIALIALARRAAALRAVKEHPSPVPRILLAGPERTSPRKTSGDRCSAPVISVSVDQAAGARKAVRHLVETGRRRLVHIAGDLGYVDATVRRDAFVSTCRELGVEPHVVEGRGWSALDGLSAAEEALAWCPEGIFAANDDLALGAMRSLQVAGVRVPEDVAIVGFDDAPASRFLTPTLSSVIQDFDAIGRAVMDQVVAASREDELSDVIIGSRLVVRESSRPRKPTATS